MKKYLLVMLSALMLMSGALVSTKNGNSIPMMVYAATGDKVDDLGLPQTIDLSETNLTVVKKAPKYQLTYTIYPETANQTVKWTSSDTKVATVDSNGKITAKKVGHTQIKCESMVRESVYKTCYVNVVEPTTAIEEFTADKEEYNVVIGKRVKLQYDIEPSYASNKYIKFKVEDSDVCTVDSSGYVYGVEEGDTSIVATTDDGGFELTFYVTVSQVNNGTYDKFEEDYPELHVSNTTNVDEGIWMEVDNIGTLFYDNFKGEFRKGWHVIGGSQYYFESKTINIPRDDYNENGDQLTNSYTFPIMFTGWYKSLAEWNYLKTDGKLANNEWIRDNNKSYLFDKDGGMISGGEKWIGSEKYLFADTGEAIVGFRMVEGKIKHYNQDTYGMDINEWFKEIDGRWYYADANGDLIKNQYIKAADGSCDYYLDVEGVMSFNKSTPDGRWADESGKIEYTPTETKADDFKKETKPYNYGPGYVNNNTTPVN